MQRAFREFAAAFAKLRRPADTAELAWLTGESWQAILTPPKAWGRILLVCLAVAVWLGLVGPFGNALAGPPWKRIAYQACLAAVCAPSFGLGLRAATRLGLERGLPLWLTAPASVLAVALPASAIIAQIGPLFFPRLASVLAPHDWYLQTVTVMLPMAAPWVLVIGWRVAAAGPQLFAPRGAGGRLALGCAAREIVALQAEDHYVRVHTRTGSRLVLARLCDAIAALDGAPGLQVHRSWWVAATAVREIAPRGRAWRARLETGLEAAVSSRQLEALRGLAP